MWQPRSLKVTARALLSTLPVKQVSLMGSGNKVYSGVREPSKLSQLVLIMSLISPLGESHSGTVCIEVPCGVTVEKQHLQRVICFGKA